MWGNIAIGIGVALFVVYLIANIVEMVQDNRAKKADEVKRTLGL